MAEIIRINSNTWRIEDDGVRFFLLEGRDEALMIDSGMNTPDAKAIAETVTQLPLKLLNTHADPDHISGNEAFGEFYMHPSEWENYRVHGKNGKLIPVSDGDVLDLGGRKLTVIDLPGHTPGSIAVLDPDARVLFGGDAIQDGRIFMFGPRRDFPSYIESLAALWERYADAFDEIYPSHGSIPVRPDLIPRLIGAAQEICTGSAAGHETAFMGRQIQVCDFGFATFLCEGSCSSR